MTTVDMQPEESSHADIHERTLLEALLRSAVDQPAATALRESDGDRELTWSEYAAATAALAAGLRHLGCRPGDRVAMLISNRPEWQLADMAALAIGAVPYSLYTNVSAQQVQEHLADGGARILIAERRILERLGMTKVAGVERVVVIGSEPPALELPGVVAWDRLGDLAPALDLTELAEDVHPDQVATLIFTSGTTGKAKQVQLSHANVIAVAAEIARTARMDRRAPGRVVSYLPHAHIVDRIVGHYVPLITSATVTTVADARKVFQHLPAIKPTMFTSVPRLWELMRADLMSRFQNGSDDQEFGAALDRAFNHLAQVRTSNPTSNVAVAPPAEDARLWAGLKDQVGLGECAWLVTGSAPLSAGTHDFFEAIGIPLHDCWGLSECAGLATVNRPGDRRPGSVGRPLPGTEVSIDDDGEVLIRGPHVMVGYRDNPSANATAFTEDGWYRTGDLGRLEGGHLYLSGRKKELLITEGGENVAPARVEAVLVDSSPLIAQACVVGDGRAHLAALLVLDTEIAEKYGDDASLHAAVEAAVETANTQLARFERIRYHAVLKSPFAHETGELTPTLKLRRSAVTEKNADLIAALYRQR